VLKTIIKVKQKKDYGGVWVESDMVLVLGYRGGILTAVKGGRCKSITNID
jgi:hypothetical protein